MGNIKKKVEGWKTTKKSLYFALAAFALYTGINLYLNSQGESVDDTLTECVFDFLMTVVVGSGAVSGVKVWKGSTENQEGVE